MAGDGRSTLPLLDQDGRHAAGLGRHAHRHHRHAEIGERPSGRSQDVAVEQQHPVGLTGADQIDQRQLLGIAVLQVADQQAVAVAR